MDQVQDGCLIEVDALVASLKDMIELVESNEITTGFGTLLEAKMLVRRIEEAIDPKQLDLFQ